MTSREAFKAKYPALDAELSLGEQNPEFHGLEDLRARHAFSYFTAGWQARDAEIAALRATLRKLLELAGADADDLEWIKAWAVARSLIDAQRNPT